MSPPTGSVYVLQCTCGGQLTVHRGKSVTCPACGCVHLWADLYPRLDYPPPPDEHEPPAGPPEPSP